MKNAPKISSLLFGCGLALAIAGCSPNVDIRGNLPIPEQLAQVKIGKSTREDVQALIGTPSSTTMFGDETWLYVSARTEYVAFFEPEIKERKVVTVVFDRSGVVKAIDNRGLEDGKDIEMVARETPTAGKEMSILEQLVGNVGRFSKDPKGK